MWMRLFYIVVNYCYRAKYLNQRERRQYNINNDSTSNNITNLNPWDIWLEYYDDIVSFIVFYIWLSNLHDYGPTGQHILWRRIEIMNYDKRWIGVRCIFNIEILRLTINRELLAFQCINLAFTLLALNSRTPKLNPYICNCWTYFFLSPAVDLKLQPFSLTWFSYPYLSNLTWNKNKI